MLVLCSSSFLVLTAMHHTEAPATDLFIAASILAQIRSSVLDAETGAIGHRLAIRVRARLSPGKGAVGSTQTALHSILRAAFELAD